MLSYGLGTSEYELPNEYYDGVDKQESPSSIARNRTGIWEAQHNKLRNTDPRLSPDMTSPDDYETGYIYDDDGLLTDSCG